MSGFQVISNGIFPLDANPYLLEVIGAVFQPILVFFSGNFSIFYRIILEFFDGLLTSTAESADLPPLCTARSADSRLAP